LVVVLLVFTIGTRKVGLFLYFFRVEKMTTNFSFLRPRCEEMLTVMLSE